MLPPRTQQKYCSVQECQELPGPCVGLAAWSPRGRAGCPCSQGGGVGPSLHQVFSQSPLHALVFPQIEISALVMDWECAKSSSLHVLKELEVWWLGSPPARTADPCPSRHVS